MWPMMCRVSGWLEGGEVEDEDEIEGLTPGMSEGWEKPRVHSAAMLDWNGLAPTETLPLLFIQNPTLFKAGP